MDGRLSGLYGDSIFLNKSSGTMQRSITAFKIPKAERFKKSNSSKILKNSKEKNQRKTMEHFLITIVIFTHLLAKKGQRLRNTLVL